MYALFSFTPGSALLTAPISCSTDGSATSVYKVHVETVEEPAEPRGRSRSPLPRRQLAQPRRIGRGRLRPPRASPRSPFLVFARAAPALLESCARRSADGANDASVLAWRKTTRAHFVRTAAA
jgi:hypothetical protein